MPLTEASPHQSCIRMTASPPGRSHRMVQTKAFPLVGKGDRLRWMRGFCDNKIIIKSKSLYIHAALRRHPLISLASARQLPPRGKPFDGAKHLGRKNSPNKTKTERRTLK